MMLALQDQLNNLRTLKDKPLPQVLVLQGQDNNNNPINKDKALPPQVLQVNNQHAPRVLPQQVLQVNHHPVHKDESVHQVLQGPVKSHPSPEDNKVLAPQVPQ